MNTAAELLTQLKAGPDAGLSAHATERLYREFKLASYREGLAESRRLARVGDLDTALFLLGRNEASSRLREFDDCGLITDAQLAGVLLHVWNMVEWPCRALPRKRWLAWFRRTGYITDVGDVAWGGTRRLYRAQAGRTMGLSWTPDRDLAQWYHDRNLNSFRFPNARLLERDVPWSGVLATLNDRTEGKVEVLVDPGVARA